MDLPKTRKGHVMPYLGGRSLVEINIFCSKKKKATTKEKTQLFIKETYRLHGLFKETVNNTWIQTFLMAFG
jgi:hypothetical protein